MGDAGDLCERSSACQRYHGGLGRPYNDCIDIGMLVEDVLPELGHADTSHDNPCVRVVLLEESCRLKGPVRVNDPVEGHPVHISLEVMDVALGIQSRVLDHKGPEVHHAGADTLAVEEIGQGHQTDRQHGELVGVGLGPTGRPREKRARPKIERGGRMDKDYIGHRARTCLPTNGLVAGDLCPAQFGVDGTFDVALGPEEREEHEELGPDQSIAASASDGSTHRPEQSLLPGSARLQVTGGQGILKMTDRILRTVLHCGPRCNYSVTPQL